MKFTNKLSVHLTFALKLCAEMDISWTETFITLRRSEHHVYYEYWANISGILAFITFHNYSVASLLASWLLLALGKNCRTAAQLPGF